MNILHLFFPKEGVFAQLASTHDFSYIDGENQSILVDFLRKSKRDLRQRTRWSFWDRYKLRSSIRKKRKESTSSLEAIVRGYDEEYGEGRISYGYTSILLSRPGFELVTGIRPEAAKDLRVLDVGAGSNEFLRFCRDGLNVPASQLHGSDVSPESVRIIGSDGFTGHGGRLEELALPRESFDLLCLSYFIDYDTDQAATFSAAIDLVRPGGIIVLEGCFPVRPFALLESDTHTFSFVTKGESASQDIALVQGSFSQLGEKKGRRVVLKQVVCTHRFVQSHYGFNKLPSYFLTFTVEA